MKKISRFLSIILTICLIATGSVFAHSGRTDKNGGHRDNKNVSGLGSYHYHCGGFPAHLHPNGVCPYTSKASNSSNNSTVSSYQAPQNKDYKTSVSDIKAYINDIFIPSLNYKNYTFIVAENLNDYGFDVEWNGEDKTLKIARNSDKEITAKNTSNFNKEYTIETTENKTLLYNKDKGNYEAIESYSIGGQTIIKLEDLGGTVDWNADTRTIKLSI